MKTFGFALTETVRAAICLVPKEAWTPAVAADGQVRDHADVVEITDLLTLTRWPSGIRVIVRREHPTPARNCPCSSTGTGGATKPSSPTPPSGRSGSSKPDTGHTPCSSRVEDRIRVAKDTGLSRFPSREYDINQAWLTLVAIAADLTAWLRLLALPPALASCEPKALRYRFLHMPARLTRGSRRRRLRMPATWPWVRDAVATFTNVLAIPMLT